jgi:type IV pilus assembly protein PilW
MKYRHVTGFTILEMMVATTISLILMAGAFSIFMSSKRTYTLQDELAKLQENARFIFDDIAYSVRMSGYFGCAGKAPSNSPVTISLSSFSTGDNNLSILDGSTTGSTSELKKAIPLSDRLTVNYFNNPLHAPPSGADNSWDDFQNPQKASTIFAQGQTLIPLGVDNILPAANDVLIVGDCGGAEIYTVKAAANSGVTIAGGFLRNYFWPISVTRIVDNVNFSSAISYEVRGIDKTGDGTANQPQDGFMLFKTLGGQMRPFIEGVENLQVRYGIDSNSDKVADQYVALPIGGKVVSLRITLLMRTANFRADLGADEGVYQLDPDITYTPADIGYRRRLISTTINIRNQ